MKKYHMETKFLICPGKVTSLYDGDEHFITAGQLMSLYHLKSEDCTVLDSAELARGINWDDYIVLRPRRDGDYQPMNQYPTNTSII